MCFCGDGTALNVKYIENIRDEHLQQIVALIEPCTAAACDEAMTKWAILQYPGHLHREILIFSQKSLRTIYTYHLVPFKLPKNVQRGPFQGLLVFRYFSQKISNFTK